MDLNALMSTMLSSDSVESMSKRTGVSAADVTSILSSGLPALLSGAKEQATSQDTLSGFANALTQHAKADTSSLSSFLSGVDLEDGGKILSHLLGGGKTETAQAAAANTGASAEQSTSVLSAAAPLLMSLLGQQTSQEQSAQESSGGSNILGGLFGSLLGGSDLGGLMSSLLGGKK